MNPAQELLEIAKEQAQRKKRNQIALWFPTVDSEHPWEKNKDGSPKYFYSRDKYAKFLQFFEAGAEHNYRMLMGGNQVGKTYTAAIEVVFHLTGMYPDWWKGRRIHGPNRWWIAGETNKDVKTIMQDRLIGPVEQRGTGLIPFNCLDLQSMVETDKEDTPIPTIRVKHFDKDGNFDGMSAIQFKSYEAGRKSFQGLPRNVWLDEEPPQDVYGECVARLTSDENLMMIVTFTPLGGTTKLIRDFLGSQRDTGPVLKNGVDIGRFLVRVEDTEVPHISEKKRKENEENFPEYQREARRKGLPILGAGAIYPMDQKLYVVPWMEIPPHWKKVYGLDVGWNFTAVVWMAINPANGVRYIYDEHKAGQLEPMGHAEAVRGRGLWVPGVIDSAANGRGQDGGDSLIDQYRALGLHISNADKSVDAGIFQVWTGLRSGNIKIMDSCVQTLEEIRNYARDEKGKVIKANDHLMDAFRYVVMSGPDVAKTQNSQSTAGFGPTYVSSKYRGVY